MTKEQMDQAVKDFHKYFVEKNTTYNQAMWVLDMLKKQYDEKSCQAINDTLVDNLAKVKLLHATERLI